MLFTKARTTSAACDEKLPVVFHYRSRPRRLREMAARVFDALRAGTLRPQVTHYALSAAGAAHRGLEARRTVGQIVLLG